MKSYQYSEGGVAEGISGVGSQHILLSHSLGFLKSIFPEAHALPAPKFHPTESSCQYPRFPQTLGDAPHFLVNPTLEKEPQDSVNPVTLSFSPKTDA